MKRPRSALIFGAVLLLSVAWMGTGLWVALDGMARHALFETRAGIVMVFPSSVFVPIVLAALINLLVPGERLRGPHLWPSVLMMLLYSGGFALFLGHSRHHGSSTSPTTVFWVIFCALLFALVVAYFKGRRVRAALKRPMLPARSPRLAQLRIKRLERDLRNLNFMRRHPGVVLLFLLGALVVLTAMIFTPATLSDPTSAAALHAFGYVFGMAYVVLLIAFLGIWITNRWESYLDFYIRQTTDRLAQAKSLDGPPSEPPSS